MAKFKKSSIPVAGELVRQGFHVSCTQNNVLAVSMPMVKAFTAGLKNQTPHVFKVDVDDDTPWFVFHVKCDGVFWVLSLNDIKKHWGDTISENYFTVSVPKKGENKFSKYRDDEGFERLRKSIQGIAK